MLLRTIAICAVNSTPIMPGGLALAVDAMRPAERRQCGVPLNSSVKGTDRLIDYIHAPFYRSLNFT